MSYSIHVDVGGTFMDFFVSDNSKHVISKVPTTTYELGAGFLRGVEDCAVQLGISVEDFLANTESIRYSTTIGTNAMLQHKGPNLGLIATAGYEDTIFIGRGRQWADGMAHSEVKDMTKIQKPVPLIPRKMVVGVRERIDCFGNIIAPLVKEEVLDKVRYLVDNGARGFVVCLLWSFLNPDHEQEIKRIIQEEFPDIYLGNMPIILSSEISPKEGEYTRTMTAIVDGYMHSELAQEMSSLAEHLRERGYTKPLLLVHNTGGSKKVSRTKAVNTHNASPVAGLCGALYVSKVCNLPNVVYTDVGGTSFDLGLIVKGTLPFYDLFPVIDRWRTQLRAIETISIGAGGGSIAWLNPLLGNRLEVGPMSAGAMPGPACYDLGGEDATVTDADVLLGYVSPDYYLGGRMKLNRVKAQKAIKALADKLGASEIATATMIKRVVDVKMGQEIFKRVALAGYDPGEFTLFACGGAGPMHCCGYAPPAGLTKILTSPFSPVFGAFGVGTLDVKHIYDKSRHIKVFDFTTQTYFSEFEMFNAVIRELQASAIKDMRLEGFPEDRVIFTLALEMRYGTQYSYTRVQSPLTAINNEEDARRLCDAFTETYSKNYGLESAFPEGGIDVETFMLTAHVPGTNFPMKKYKLENAIPPGESIKGEREAYWDELGGFKKTTVYCWERLKAGTIIDGPAIIEAENTTYVIAPGWRYKVDQYLNGFIELMKK
ncbi:MAG: hypothetical protein A2Z02_06950 [Chloroflexi bacterium RBG_16_48_7]|nr:MAG: hypothetical protein A2Z02_06950 [Chloroflexi bacterium RBG_16_48_7]